MKIWNFTDSHMEDYSIITKNTEIPPNVYGFGHVRYIENVCDNLLTNKEALVDGLEGRKSLELINAIYESIETGKEVFLRFIPNKCKLGEKSL